MSTVARAAGVSRQTVSNVLNAPHVVHPDTRARVEAVIREVGYRPNRVARSLRTRSTHLIGYCVGGDNPLLDRFLHAMSTAAGQRGYHLVLFTAPPGADGLPAYEDLLARNTVDGFVLSETTVGDRRPAWLASRGVPFVAFGRPWSSDPAVDVGSWVDVDGAAGTAAATRHLYDLGHRRIGFVGWPAGSGSGDDRLRGWREECARLGLGEQPAAHGENGIEHGAALATTLLTAPEPPTALVCVSDVMALGAQQAARAAGRAVALVGFDDSPLAALPGIDLTSVRQPVERIGRDVVRLLLDQLGDGPVTAHTAVPDAQAGTAPDAGPDDRTGPPPDTRPDTGPAPQRLLLEPTLVPRLSSTHPTKEQP
ncbi:MAG TPA: LacI family DNA-binding transcriptional regulator [Pseudonocardiaceae bacterium]